MTDVMEADVSSEKQPSPKPPPSPDFERQLELYSYQYIAIPLLLLIPFLAILGVFGETTAAIQANAASLSLEVAFPDRMHAGMGNEITVEVTNDSGEDLPLLEVLVDQTYLRKFVDVRFTPEPNRVTNAYAAFEIPDVLAGETRVISIEFEGLWVGRHEASIAARTSTGENVSTTISTFVFP